MVLSAAVGNERRQEAVYVYPVEIREIGFFLWKDEELNIFYLKLRNIKP